MTDSVQRHQPFVLFYWSHHVHSPQFAGFDTTNSTQRGGFGDSLAELDLVVGRLLRKLDDLQIADDTLVFFSSDNGPSLRNRALGGNAGLLKCGKGTTYEGGMRVPGLARWPTKIPAGVIQRQTASLLDLLPTVVRLAADANITVSDDELVSQLYLPTDNDNDSAATVTLDGFDISGLLTDPEGTSARQGRMVFYPQILRRDRGLYAARSTRAKVHWHTEGSIQSGTSNPDLDCRPTATFSTPIPPLAFDIGVDPSEVYPLNASETPVTGEMDYHSAVNAATKVASDHVRGLVWGPKPLLNAGSFDPALWPCAKPGCHPFPQCCVTS